MLVDGASRRAAAATRKYESDLQPGGYVMRLSGPLAALTLLLAVSFPLTAARAQDTKVEVRSPDTVKMVLDRLVGKRVSLVLTTGPELAGIVSVVGDKVVLLTDLTNRE